MGSNPPLRQEQMPTLAKADEVLAENSRERHAHAGRERRALPGERILGLRPCARRSNASARRCFAINFADDLINPPELGILEREIKRVKRGAAIVIPLSPQTRGHGTHTIARVVEAVPGQTTRRHRALASESISDRSAP